MAAPVRSIDHYMIRRFCPEIQRQRKRYKKSKNWNMLETSFLLETWAEPEFQKKLESCVHNHHIWEQILAKLIVKIPNFERTAEQCKEKLDNLRKKYKRVKRAELDTCPFFDELDYVLAGSHPNEIPKPSKDLIAQIKIDVSSVSGENGFAETILENSFEDDVFQQESTSEVSYDQSSSHSLVKEVNNSENSLSLIPEVKPVAETSQNRLTNEVSIVQPCSPSLIKTVYNSENCQRLENEAKFIAKAYPNQLSNEAFAGQSSSPPQMKDAKTSESSSSFHPEVTPAVDPDYNPFQDGANPVLIHPVRKRKRKKNSAVTEAMDHVIDRLINFQDVQEDKFAKMLINLERDRREWEKIMEEQRHKWEMEIEEQRLRFQREVDETRRKDNQEFLLKLASILAGNGTKSSSPS